jgi:hypothetical protein
MWKKAASKRKETTDQSKPQFDLEVTEHTSLKIKGWLLL